VVALVREGRLRALSIGAARRLGDFPNLPTVAEAGFPFMAVDAWFGLFAPRGTPIPRVEQISAAFLQALGDPAVAQRAVQAGLNAAPMTMQEFGAFQQEEVARWREMATLTGITME
jgi:tripartite-type tricarboxylate transporter receptor subunit TctC